MIITCIKGGLLPDFNKCIPFGEHDIAMYIDENIYFVFYDIFDCKTQSRFSLSTFLDIDKEAGITREEMDFRSSYFIKHKKALVSKALKNPEDTLFFNSIEVEVLSKYFYEMKLSCKVDIFINDERVELEDVLDKKEFKTIESFIEFFDMCEYVNAKELAEIRKGLYKPKLNKFKIAVGGAIVGTLGVIAGVALGYKFSSKKNVNIDMSQASIGQEA